MRVFGQESFKEMAVSNEIRFTKAQNQRLGAKISKNCDSSGNKKLFILTLLASFVFNTYTPLRISERFFKLISFHANLLFSTSKHPETGFLSRAGK